jgi:hypothetical protein
MNGWDGVYQSNGDGVLSNTDLSDDAMFLGADPSLHRNITRLRQAVADSRPEEILLILKELVPDFNHVTLDASGPIFRDS